MAAPNLLNTNTITAKSVFAELTTSDTDILENTAFSDKVYKINNIIISNIDGTNPADVTVSVNKNGTAYKIASTISVPNDATLILIDRNTAIYLEENDKISALAGANSDLNIMINYEELS
jgi:hypothetical protein